MNIIILPATERAIARDAPQAYAGDARLAHVRGWLSWLTERGETLWVQAYLPAQNARAQSDIIRFLIECERDFKVGNSLMLTADDVRDGILEHPYLVCIDELVLRFDPQTEELDEQLIAAIDAYQTRAAEQKQQAFSLWIQEGVDRGRHVRLQPWLRRKHEIQIYTDPFVQRGGLSTPGIQNSAQLPPEYLKDLPACRLLDSALTIAANGRIEACPQIARHCGSSLDLGNVLEDSLESILIKRGQQRHKQLSSAVCRNCRIDGRFSWPDSRGEAVCGLMLAGATEQIKKAEQDEVATPLTLSQASPDALEGVFTRFRQTLDEWARRDQPHSIGAGEQFVSIETPVIKAEWLIPCIESVLSQTSPNWYFSLLWDRGDELARRILDELKALNHPRISVHYGDGLGIARARRFLTDRSQGDYILPLDDDDLLAPNAVETFLTAAASMPWAGIIRGRREFIDDSGNPVSMDDWFPFEARQYVGGMTRDVYNHCQPYAISRAIYLLTNGWEGFPEYKYAGEDCDLFLKIEELAEIELLEEVLYYYRINPSRTSVGLGVEVAHDMWRRLADAALRRRALPLRRTSDVQPFTFEVIGAEPIERRGNGGGIHQPNGNHQSTLSDLMFVTRHDSRANSLVDLKHRTEPFVCFVGDGVEPPAPNLLHEIIETMEALKADLAGPRFVDEDGRVIAADPHFSANMLPSVSGMGELDSGQYQACLPAAWIPPALLIVRTAVFRSVGGFDPTYSSRDLQSADFCLRARSRGFRCAYLGSIPVVQKPNGTQPGVPEEIDRFTARWGRAVHLLYAIEEAVTV